jgi:hypothetical protein
MGSVFSSRAFLRREPRPGRWARVLTVRVRRVAVILCLLGAAVAATVPTAAPARASVVIGAGELTINPANGPVSTSPTWSMLTACPAGFQTSAVLDSVKTGGTVFSPISPAVAGASSPFSGTLTPGATVGSVLAAENVTAAETVEWVVLCFSGPNGTGDDEAVQAINLTLSADGSSYTTACTFGTACLIQTSGASSLTPAWVTRDACPPAYFGSAALYTLNGDGSLGSRISPVVAGVETPFGGTLLADVAQDLSGAGVTDGESDEWVVVCFTGPGGTGQGDDNGPIYVTLSADGSSYTASSTPPPLTATTTTMTASPAVLNAPFTMTATVTAADGTHPPGSVEFFAGGSEIIGFPVAVNADGVASTIANVIFPVGSFQLEAVFTAADIFSYASSTGTFTEMVPFVGGTQPVTLTVPPSGAVILTVTPGPVTLNVSGSIATGALNRITVSDTRNTFPGWSVSGQASIFTGSGTAASATISGNQLGWMPTDTSLGTGVTLGGTVAPGSPGLGTTPAILASAAAGNGLGTSVLGGNLTLDIPALAEAGPYVSTLTVTLVTTGP